MTAKTPAVILFLLVLSGCKQEDQVEGCAYRRGEIVILAPENALVQVVAIRWEKYGCDYIVKSRVLGALSRISERELSRP